MRRNGNKVPIPGKEKSDPNQTKIDISEILRHAEPGDYLVIEAVRKEDGPVKRILKLLGLGCYHLKSVGNEKTSPQRPPFSSESYDE